MSHCHHPPSLSQHRRISSNFAPHSVNLTIHHPVNEVLQRLPPSPPLSLILPQPLIDTRLSTAILSVPSGTHPSQNPPKHPKSSTPQKSKLKSSIFLLLARKHRLSLSHRVRPPSEVESPNHQQFETNRSKPHNAIHHKTSLYSQQKILTSFQHQVLHHSKKKKITPREYHPSTVWEYSTRTHTTLNSVPESFGTFLVTERRLSDWKRVTSEESGKITGICRWILGIGHWILNIGRGDWPWRLGLDADPKAWHWQL
ncbi:hypothetical protein BKA64DRAFT_648617 [Cadophora sp. MPI-SDFR-AT-0126]|nr:hypothetical protein BKA64DRAFT_648617 [Leotiomycetes sp. MPI-SDFR-AT-0126]